MLTHLHDDQSLEIVFGVPEGDHIRFVVCNPTCPNADEDWYRSQLDTEIHIHVEMYRGYRSLVMFSDDFHRFLRALKKLASGEAIVAALETGDFLTVDVRSIESSFEVWMQLDALEEDGEMVLRDAGAENWEWRLTIDYFSLNALIDSVTQVSDRYPISSVPKI